MGILGDKLTEARLAKKNDTKTFVWKGPKRIVNKKYEQDSMKLIDASEEQLNKFYNHCRKMLYNNNRENPGRYVLLDIIQEQRNNCNVELFLRYIENNSYKADPTRRGIERHEFYGMMLGKMMEQGIDKEEWKNIKVSQIMSAPTEFDSLTLDKIMDGCLDLLGSFNRSHLTLTFLTGLGLWFTEQEKKELNDSKNKNLDKLDIVRQRLNIPVNIQLRLSDTGLSFHELRAMLTLKNKKYSDLTTEQLVTLRNKVLYRYDSVVRQHIYQWAEKMRQIELVAEEKGFKLKDD